MVKAVLHSGRIEPTSPLPSSWAEGRLLVIAEAPSEGERDLELWAREIEELAAQIPAEDFDRLDAALAQADIEAKGIVRRQMGLS